MHTIIEQFTMSKTGREEDNEDLIYSDGRFTAVVDGATGKSGNRLHGRTGGAIAAALVADVLRSLDGTENREQVFSALIEEFIKYAAENRLTETGVHLCASVAIYSDHHRQIWSLGDCRYRVDGRLYDNVKEIDVVLARARAAAIYCLLEEGMTEAELMENDISREMIMPILKKQHCLENASGPFGYSCLHAAEDGCVERLLSRIRCVDVCPESEVVLASDGYPLVEGSLVESEKVLMDVLREDPLCFRLFPSTKGVSKGCVSFDDRSYVRLIAGV